MNKLIKNLVILSSAPLIFTGCLKTRSEVKDVEQRQVLQQQVSSLQKERADSGQQIESVNEELRELRGRLEIAEAKAGTASSEVEKARKGLSEQNQESGRKVDLLQETLAKMDAQMQAQNAEIAALKAEIAAKAARENVAAASSSSGKHDHYEEGLDHFQAKNWKKSILSFQKYRDANPKGKKFAEVTYLMGVSFQELGMKDEARTFYEEVESKFPKSNEAKKAHTRTKSLKSSKK